MIKFTKIIMKNFLGIGNTPIEIDFVKSKTTLVEGKNGSGKSSLLTDSIVFALFGKAYRNINIGQLINSINSKDCVVELHFAIGKMQYRIIRGLKPKIFEIYKDGVLLNQDASARDYQKYLEQNIIKMNFRSFSQIVILSSGNYTPFMQLSAAERRNVIEDFLDIQVFSKMNELLKSKIQDTKSAIELNTNNQVSYKNQLNVHKEYLQKLKASDTNKIDNLKKQKEDVGSELLDKISKVKDIESSLVIPAEIDELQNQFNQLRVDIRICEQEINRIEEKKKFIHETACCSSCNQVISEEHKIVEIQKYEALIESHNEELRTLLIELDNVKKLLETAQQEINTYNNLTKEKEKLNYLIKIEKDNLQSIIKEIDSLHKSSKEDNKDILVKIQDIVEKVKILAEEKSVLLNRLNVFSDGIVMLKDSGIKTKIIKQYIPIINKTINKYLAQMGLNVQFVLNEQFVEEIKTKYKETYSYASFSEGEKARIDLALMFTWREIAKLRNSVSTNLLVLDEVFSGNLDSDADDALIEIMDNITNSNIFVISHKASALHERFHSTIKVEQKNGFTKFF